MIGCTLTVSCQHFEIAEKEKLLAPTFCGMNHPCTKDSWGKDSKRFLVSRAICHVHVLH